LTLKPMAKPFKMGVQPAGLSVPLSLSPCQESLFGF
jgi:hypothetical protein